MSENKVKLSGFILAITGAILGLGLFLVLYLNNYELYIDKQLEIYPDKTSFRVITYILPLFTVFAMLAGAMYLVSAYGFLRKASWAYALATVANVLAVQFSFWPMIPAMDTRVNPVFLWVFFPNGIIFILLHFRVGKRSFGQILIGLLAGMAFVVSWINGTASLNMSWMPERFPDNSLYILANPLHWIIAFSFGVICVGIFLFPKKEWIRMLGIGVGAIEIILGVPMAIIATLQKGEFSLYAAAPFFSVLLIFLFAFPKLWNKFLKLNSDRAEKSWMIYA